MESLLETAAGGIGAALGTAITSPALATSLAELLPDALFFRCGANLATWRSVGSAWGATAARGALCELAAGRLCRCCAAGPCMRLPAAFSAAACSESNTQMLARQAAHPDRRCAEPSLGRLPASPTCPQGLAALRRGAVCV